MTPLARALQAFYALHDPAEKIALRTKWMRFLSAPWAQPLATEPGVCSAAASPPRLRT